MIITETTIRKIDISDKEKFALDLIDELLADFQNILDPDKNYFVSINTGECLSYEALTTAREVIRGIRDNESWEMKA